MHDKFLHPQKDEGREGERGRLVPAINQALAPSSSRLCTEFSTAARRAQGGEKRVTNEVDVEQGRA